MPPGVVVWDKAPCSKLRGIRRRRIKSYGECMLVMAWESLRARIFREGSSGLHAFATSLHEEGGVILVSAISDPLHNGPIFGIHIFLVSC